MKHISKVLLIIAFLLSSYFLIQDASVYFLQKQIIGMDLWNFLSTSTYSLPLFLGYALVVGAIVFFFYEKVKPFIMALTVAYAIILMGNLARYLLIFVSIFFDFFISIYGYYQELKIIIFLALWIGFYFIKPGKDGFDFVKVCALATLPFLLSMFSFRLYMPIEEGLDILVFLFTGGVIFLAVPFVTAVWITIKKALKDDNIKT